jgi:hypothetical protein
MVAERVRFERVLGLYSLGVVSVQCALVGGDWVVWVVCWGRRRGLSPVVWVQSSVACCANGTGSGSVHVQGFRDTARARECSIVQGKGGVVMYVRCRAGSFAAGKVSMRA